MTRANLVDPELERYVQRGLSLPDVVLVSCQPLCHCTPACPSPAAAGHCQGGFSGQSSYLLRGSASPALTQSTRPCSTHTPEHKMWRLSQRHEAGTPQNLHSQTFPGSPVGVDRCVPAGAQILR